MNSPPDFERLGTPSSSNRSQILDSAGPSLQNSPSDCLNPFLSYSPLPSNATETLHSNLTSFSPSSEMFRPTSSQSPPSSVIHSQPSNAHNSNPFIFNFQPNVTPIPSIPSNQPNTELDSGNDFETPPSPSPPSSLLTNDTLEFQTIARRPRERPDPLEQLDSWPYSQSSQANLFENSTDHPEQDFYFSRQSFRLPQDGYSSTQPYDNPLALSLLSQLVVIESEKWIFEGIQSSFDF